MNMTTEEIEKIIKTELEANLHVLIDKKQKNSFSQARINVWVDLVKRRLMYHIFENKAETGN